MVAKVMTNAVNIHPSNVLLMNTVTRINGKKIHNLQMSIKNISVIISYAPTNLFTFLIREPEKLLEKNLYECLCK